MNFNSLCLQTLQIMIPHNTDKHYTLYVLNKYTNSIDILDSLNYKHGGGKNTWKTHHKDHPELVRQFNLGFLIGFPIPAFPFLMAKSNNNTKP